MEFTHRHIFTHAYNGIAIVALDGSWIEVNDSVCQITGYSKEELYQLTFQDITHKDDLERDISYLDQLVSGEIEDYQIEKRYFHKSGKLIWVLLSVTVVRDESGTPKHFISQLIDITKRKEDENEIGNLLEVVQEQNERLKNFAKITTHDIRNHISNIVWLAQFIEDKNTHLLEDNNFVLLKEAVNNLVTTMDDLNSLTCNKILAKDKLEPLNLYHHVNSAIYNVAGLAKSANVTIINDIDPQDTVMATPVYLDSIIINFLTNAIKYKSDKRDGFIKLSSGFRKQFIVLYIEDNGLGMDLEKMGNKLFQLHQTFHKHPDSKGIGLHITKRHIENIGGAVEVESKLDKGTTFKIYLKDAVAAMKEKNVQNKQAIEDSINTINEVNKLDTNATAIKVG